MKTEKNPDRQKGGIARAEALSKVERSAIAKKAADARWADPIPMATHAGVIKIGEIEIACAVLPDGRRVLSERTITKAFGGKRGGSHWQRKKAAGGGAELPVYLSANNIKPFISKDLEAALNSPVRFKIDASGASAGNGIEARYLPQICSVYLKMRDAGKDLGSQKHLVVQADMLMRGLAEVGINALVDEATGYQEVRDKHALQAILDKFLKAELAAWAKKFPDEFYQQMFRLRGWEWKGMKVNRPQIVGSYTKDIVYERLAPDLLSELERRNPVIEGGGRKSKHHQWLTDDVGNPALAQHLHAVIGFMRASTDWKSFKDLLDRAFPKRGQTLRMF